MAELEDAHTRPSALRSKLCPPERKTTKQHPSEEKKWHPRLRSYESMDRTLVDEFLKHCPKATSLTPSPNSLPMTPRTYPEMESYLKKAQFHQGRLPTTDSEWWKWEGRKQNMKARMLEIEYRFTLGQGADWWHESDWECRSKDLRMIMQDFRRNREKWMNCVGCVNGCNWNSWAMRREESKRARRFGGLVHVVLLEEKLQNVIKEIKLEGDENWIWKEMTTERRDEYFRIEDKYIREEEDIEREYLDVTEEPDTSR